MTDDRQAESIDDILYGHLESADLPEAVRDLIFAALCGAEHLTAMVGGEATIRRLERPTTNGESPKPVPVYLAGIDVTGFRGIGSTASLNLVPGPGLTIVTGRNGCGKSSFAEAVEFAITGDNKRWAGRSAIWKKDWRNLHTDEASHIRVRLALDGHRNGMAVECRWSDDADLGDPVRGVQQGGKPRRPLEDLGWSRYLDLYRPFLSYSELDGLIGGKPSEMHDLLYRILGLDRLVEIGNLLVDARREADQRRKAAKEELPALRAALAEHPNIRARHAEQALAGRVADLDALETLTFPDESDDDAVVAALRSLEVLHLPDREALAAETNRLRTALRQIDKLAGTPVEEARAVAGLLRDALRHHQHHPEQPCPVCGGRTLDAAWAGQAAEQVRRLTLLAEQLDTAHQAEREARRALRHMVPARPTVLTDDLAEGGIEVAALREAWQRWDNLVLANDATTMVKLAPTTFDDLAAALDPVRTAARELLRQRRLGWQEVADQIRAWITSERASRHAAVLYRHLCGAITEIRTVSAKIRDDRWAPIAAGTTRIWDTLRRDSNINLDAIKLAGIGPRRRLDMDVQIDGAPGSALSVMSQGELHSLALSLFLPRATAPESPFRFLVIDDPVQSMDPAKVYGLAQALAEVARHRQVIVFTHDDRLPAAVRHLQLDARILAVTRLARSRVTVGLAEDGAPAARYLNDATDIAKDEGMPERLRTMVACSLVRDALEHACHERVRITGLSGGMSFLDTEAAIEQARGLRPALALALIGDPKRTGDVNTVLGRIDTRASRLVREVNDGVHGNPVPNLHVLIQDGRRVAERLSRP